MHSVQHQSLPPAVQAVPIRRFADMAHANGALCRAGWIVVLDEFLDPESVFTQPPCTHNALII
ncbi:hypothetical protein [Candidatus Symbiobacter mobilis]|uniref:Uncharacterized protein n=1 Tax=Candidatus Symbiobacter mobilis CR TaxID=946483 RepID=U5N9Y2_9BURK|nr:hypothetical protein [Candidatus Symbiobacter mobilis]AGX87063.1 hypothetical protein Cenrod_0962 [Candidatus Symbiobacter mobilis CR]